jgi:hypothetical protein
LAVACMHAHAEYDDAHRPQSRVASINC